jgi:tellurite resistance protein
VKNLFEQDILSKVLVGVAKADGKIMEDERNFIQELLPEKLGTIQDIVARGEISTVEAEELKSETKKSILLLAWAVAIVDFDLSPGEIRKLNEYGSLFGLNHSEMSTIANLAKYETMTSVMDPLMPKSDLYDAASGIGLDEAEAERMLIQFKKSVSY